MVRSLLLGLPLIGCLWLLACRGDIVRPVVDNGATDCTATGDSGCAAERYCAEGGTCAARLIDGSQGCDRDRMCASDNCVDHSCCPPGCPACNGLVCLSECGDGGLDEGEACDHGLANGTACTPPINGTCQYCDPNCQWAAVSHLPSCTEALVEEACRCGETLITDGYCCSGAPQTEPCTADACGHGAVLAACTCGATTVTDGFCCNGSPSPNSCLVTTLRLDGGLESGTSVYGGEVFFPLLPYVTSGRAFDSTLHLSDAAIANTEYDGLYRDETWIELSPTTFTIPVENGSYSVHLHFVDWAANPTVAPGDRVFHVDIQGVRLLENLDIIGLVGEDAALVRSVDVVVDSGALVITVSNVTFYAEIAAIEILPHGELPLGATSPPARCGDADGLCPMPCTSAQDTDCPPTCNDGIANQGETGIDCGGPCPACAEDLDADYYLSAAGDDAADGRTRSTPWATIAKLNTEFAAGRFVAGDRIAFRRGDEFFGTLRITSSGSAGQPITIAAYGPGSAPPVVTGFATLSTWTPVGGGVFSHALPSTVAPALVRLDGVNTPVGRWPNTGHQDPYDDLMWMDDHTGTTSLTDIELPSSPSWSGAEVVIRTRRWVIERRTATHTGNSISYAPLRYEPIANTASGDKTYYFIQRHRQTLDRFGEWYYDSGAAMFFMYFGGANPTNHRVEVSTLENIARVSNAHHVTIDGLVLEGAAAHGVFLDTTSQINILSSTIRFSGQSGIVERASSDIRVEGCTIEHSNDCGIDFLSAPRSVIRLNKIAYSGFIVGMGGDGDNGYNGVVIEGASSWIDHNEIRFSGYDGVRMGGTDTRVSYNLIDTHCIHKDDGAGIYSFRGYDETGRTIDHNIILRGLGDSRWGSVWFEDTLAHGIYMDGAQDVTITDNIAAYNVGAGLFLNCNRNEIVRDNLAFDNYCGLQMTSFSGELATGLDIRENVFVARTPAQDVYRIFVQNGNEDVDDFGVSDYNILARPVDDSDIVFVNLHHYGWAPGDQTFYSLAQWQSLFGMDIHSHGALRAATTADALTLHYNASDNPTTIALPAGEHEDMTGAAHSGSLTLPAWTGTVLLKL